MFKKKMEETREYKKGFCAGIEKAKEVYAEDYKWNTYRLEEWGKRLREEKEMWEETKARYVLEQLKQLNFKIKVEM